MPKFEPGLVFWTWISFIVLLILLKKFAYPQILKGLKKREETIQQQLEEARRTKQEAQSLLEEYRQQLAEARSEAQKIINEGKQLGENMRKEILQKAQQESNEIVKRAQEEIELQKQKALLELKERIADLSLAAASKIMKKSLDPKDHQRLIEDYLAQIGELYGK
jgi:F-type H+-transporting ATPase subunit b